MLPVADAELRALASGEIVIVFAERGSLTEGDEVELSPAGSVDAATLKPAYRRWADAGPPDARYTAVVESVDPAAILDPEAGAARHIRTEPGSGDVVILRVYGPEGAVLGDDGFAARRRSVEGALRQ